jgi:hypothetical protein
LLSAEESEWNATAGVTAIPEENLHTHVLQAVAGLLEQVCVCAEGWYFEGNRVSLIDIVFITHYA